MTNTKEFEAKIPTIETSTPSKDTLRTERMTILAMKDTQGRIVAFINKSGPQVEIYTSEIAGFDEIEAILKGLCK